MGSHSLINLSNMKFGRWTVTSRYFRKNRETYWECICDCGTISSLSSKSLRRNKSISCGCYRREWASKVKKGIPSVKKHPNNLGYYNNLYNRYKKQARERNIEWSLPKDLVIKLLSGNCNYCDQEPINIMRHKKHLGFLKYNGIDRIDNSLGYINNNCVSCCRFCNSGKSNKTLSEFKEWINRCHKHMNGENNEDN